MSTPPALLGFFRQEASEYLDQIDQLLAAGQSTAPDGSTFLAQTRALRGAATMTRLPGLPELCSTLERIATGLRDKELTWDQRLHFAVRGALAELRALIDRVEQWTEADQRQARTQSVTLAAVAAGYLASVAPQVSPASPVLPIARLFPDDGSPGLVDRNPSPDVTLAERFRRDMEAAADGVAREAVNLAAGERGTQQLALSDALRRTLLGLSDVAESYGAGSIASLATRMARSAMERANDRMAIQGFAQLLMNRELDDQELAVAVRQQAMTWSGTELNPEPRLALAPHRTPPHTSTATATPAEMEVAEPDDDGHADRSAPSRATPQALPPVLAPLPPAVARQLTPAEVQRLTPDSTPIVPIESILLSGARALDRAREVHGLLAHRVMQHDALSSDPVAKALLDELSDVLDLARHS